MKTAEDVKAFIEYRDSHHKELRGGVMMYDVKNHYKWLTEFELLQHWIDHVYQPTHPTLPSDLVEEITKLQEQWDENGVGLPYHIQLSRVNNCINSLLKDHSARIAEMERELKDTKRPCYNRN